MALCGCAAAMPFVAESLWQLAEGPECGLPTPAKAEESVVIAAPEYPAA